jgi:hypothetical protein
MVSDIELIRSGTSVLRSDAEGAVDTLLGSQGRDGIQAGCPPRRHDCGEERNRYLKEGAHCHDGWLCGINPEEERSNNTRQKNCRQSTGADSRQRELQVSSQDQPINVGLLRADGDADTDFVRPARDAKGSHLCLPKIR